MKSVLSNSRFHEFNFRKSIDFLCSNVPLVGSIFTADSGPSPDNSAPATAAVIPEEIGRSAVKLVAKLGHGAFGTVHKALFAPGEGSAEHLVAVKHLNAGASASAAEQEAFCREAAINAQLQHVNVVRLIGVVTAGQPLS